MNVIYCPFLFVFLFESGLAVKRDVNFAACSFTKKLKYAIVFFYFMSSALTFFRNAMDVI